MWLQLCLGVAMICNSILANGAGGLSACAFISDLADSLLISELSSNVRLAAIWSDVDCFVSICHQLSRSIAGACATFATVEQERIFRIASIAWAAGRAKSHLWLKKSESVFPVCNAFT